MAFIFALCSAGLAITVQTTSATLDDESARSLMRRQRNSQPHLGLEAAMHEKKSIMHLITWRRAFEQDPELFAGCSSIFLDVGSNRGTHVRKLFEPQKYPECPYLRVFNEGFGAAEKRTRPHAETGICAFGFEPNPHWTSTLEKIEKAYRAQGWRVKWFAPEAVGSSSGNITMWDNNHGQNSDWGFSDVKKMDNSTRLEVPAIDLSNFIETLNKVAPAGYRLMKMDIETAEFDVLPPFLTKQLLCKNVLDKITIEWHERFLTSETSKQHAAQVHKQVTSPSRCISGPATELVNFDDESYLEDGMPLP